jgi:chorismate mutase
MRRLLGVVLVYWIFAATGQSQTVSDGASSQNLNQIPDSTSKLQRILERARGEIDSARLPQLLPAKQHVAESLAQLESFIVKDSPNGRLWSSFLRLPEIHQQLESDSPSYATLLDLETNMRQNYLGLEYPQFVRLRDAVRDFSYAARFHNQEDKFIKFLNESLEQLIDQTKQAKSVDDELTNELVTVANNLSQSKLASGSLQELRGMFSTQNIQLSIDEKLVSRLAGRPVAQPQDVDEVILGTRILGKAFMNGNVTTRLLPMHNGIGLQLDLSACLATRSRGYNRGVVLNTTSSSPVLATKQVFLSDTGVSSPPTMISTQLQSQIHSIEHRLRLVRRIAQRKAAEQKPQADAIAEARMQYRICNEFTNQVDQQVAQAQPRLAELRNRTVPEIIRVGVKQPRINLSSTSSAIWAGTMHADNHQLAALSSCPFPRPDASVVGEIHQSALSNTLAAMLAGRTIRNTSLGDYVKQFTGKVSEELKAEIEGEEWSMTFNPAEPVRIQFVDNSIVITVRIVRMTRGTQVLNEALSIKAVYLPQLENGRIMLNRQGEVEVTSDKETKGTRAVTLRSFLRNKFDKTFKTSIVTEPISFAKLQARFPQVSNLNLDINRASFKIAAGWLQVALPL